MAATPLTPIARRFARDLLRALFDYDEPEPGRAVSGRIRFGPIRAKRFLFAPTGAPVMATILTVDQVADATAEFTDAYNNPARIDGVPQWSSADETILTIAPSEDGMTAVATPAGPLGMVQVSVRADADLGEGMQEVILLGEVEVVGGRAVGGRVIFGTPRDKGPTPTP